MKASNKTSAADLNGEKLVILWRAEKKSFATNIRIAESGKACYNNFSASVLEETDRLASVAVTMRCGSAELGAPISLGKVLSTA